MSISWTLAEITSSMTASLGNRLDVTPSRASFWANEAQNVVWTALPHDLKEAIAVSSTTSGENRIILPTDFLEMLNISASSSSTGGRDVLTLINYDEIDSAGTSLERPRSYIQFADWIELHPTPDSAYSLQMRYRKQLSTMTELTAVPSVGTSFRQAVYLKGTELLAEELQQFAHASHFRTRYNTFIRSTPNDRALRLRNRHDVGFTLLRKRP